MRVLARARARMPVWAKRLLRPLYEATRGAVGKYASELAFWEARFEAEGGRFRNDHYEPTMLAIAGEANREFVRGKVVADFGCGPRGSLLWATGATMRIGIDVIADLYAEKFWSELVSHGTVYVKSTENVIPLPSGCIDILFTVNALDHVDNVQAMCDELTRVLRIGGQLIASFNIGEPVTTTEPQSLSEETLRVNLLSRFDVLSYRIARQGPPDSVYANFYRGECSYRHGEPGYLWVRAVRRE